MKPEPQKPARFPELLREEFETIEMLLNSDAATSRTDALILACTKYEKQLRKLIMFLVYTVPQITDVNRASFLNAIVECKNLYPPQMEIGICHLSGKSISEIVGDGYLKLKKAIEPVLDVRNKLIHGQNTGQDLSKLKLEKNVIIISVWMCSLAEGSKQSFGYDGLERNVFQKAKQCSSDFVAIKQFSSSDEFSTWLNWLCRRR